MPACLCGVAVSRFRASVLAQLCDLCCRCAKCTNSSSHNHIARCLLMGRAVPVSVSTPAFGAARPIAGIIVLVLSSWALSGLDASGKWVMGAGVPLLVLCWVRYVVHLLLVLGFVLPTRGVKVLRSVRPSAQIARGSIMLLATLSFFTTLH